MPEFARSAAVSFPYPSVAAMQQAMATSQTTSAALATHYLDRIADLNPVLHAVITVAPDAAADAAASDERRASR